MASMIHRLQRIVQEVNRAPDIDRALVLITESLTRDLSADACTIFLAKKENPEVLILQACSGLNPQIIGKVERKLGEGLIGTIAARAEAMNLIDAPNHKKIHAGTRIGGGRFSDYAGCTDHHAPRRARGYIGAAGGKCV